MAVASGVGFDWQVPSWIIRTRMAAEERIGIRWLNEARSAFEHDVFGPSVRVMEVSEAPELLLLAGAVDWAERLIPVFRRAGDLTPIVVLNAGAERGSSARILDAGADDCLTCPFDPSELRARIQAVLRRLEPASQRSSELAADRTTRRIRVRDVEAHVSPRQFAIFVCLAEHREHWVHSDEIIATVAGTHHASATSLVRVQIHALRKALGAARGCIRCDGHRRYMLTLGRV